MIDFLENEPPALLENVPLRTRLQMSYSMMADIHISLETSRSSSRSGEQNWPPKLPDISPLHVHVWDYMKNMVNARWTRKVTLSFNERVRLWSQADVGHFGHLLNRTL
jgi:hypothetical protein